MAKSQPGKLSFGSGGVGAANHLAGEMFNAMAGVNIVHVPYKGGSLALTDALSGQFQVMFGGIEQSLPHVRAGKLRGLAVTSARASALVPELPSVAESLPSTTQPISRNPPKDDPVPAIKKNVSSSPTSLTTL
jgi:tripartite-type tricarboxylate transporter receptor subunit TctC